MDIAFPNATQLLISYNFPKRANQLHSSSRPKGVLSLSDFFNFSLTFIGAQSIRLNPFLLGIWKASSSCKTCPSKCFVLQSPKVSHSSVFSTYFHVTRYNFRFQTHVLSISKKNPFFETCSRYKMIFCSAPVIAVTPFSAPYCLFWPFWPGGMDIFAHCFPIHCSHSCMVVVDQMVMDDLGLERRM
jgi:hypothetical protein